MTGLPNTFQAFNLYIDRAMELLTDSEFRVLMFANRHITGWQDRIDDQKGCISLSMFEKGFTTKEGTRYAGCGLRRQTIIDVLESLVGFGFLTRDGKPTVKGQKYTLNTLGVDWQKLEARFDEWSVANKKRTAKATETRLTGTSDVTSTSHDTMLGTSDVTSTSHDTMLGTSDVTQTKTISNPSSKTKSRASHSKKKTPLQLLQSRLEPHIVLAGALLELFEPGYRGSIHTPAEYLITVIQLEKYVPILEDLARLEATPDEIKAVYTYLTPGYKKNGWTIGLKTIVEKIPAYRAWKSNGGTQRSGIITGVWAESAAPELPQVALTDDERRALVASTRKAVNS